MTKLSLVKPGQAILIKVIIDDLTMSECAFGSELFNEDLLIICLCMYITNNPKGLSNVIYRYIGNNEFEVAAILEQINKGEGFFDRTLLSN